MERTPLNRCRSLMSNVNLPDHVRKRIMDEAACAQKRTLPDQREAPITPRPFASAQTGADRLATRRHRRARGLAAACAAAIVLGAVFSSGIAPLPDALSQLGIFSEPGASPSTGSAHDNHFVLSAYAAERNGGDESSATLELHDFGLTGGWGCGDLDLETGEVHSDGDDPACIGDDGQAFAQVRYLLDLTCTGTNIESVTYSIGGERVHFTSENWIYGPNSDEPIDFEQTDSFTVAYDEQNADKAKTQRNLVAYFPVNERGCEIHELLSADGDQVKQVLEDMSAESDGEEGGFPITRDDHPELLSEAEVKALSDELDLIIQRGYADLLAQAPLTLTATFEDGTTQTKSYTIAPVADFEERLAEYRAQQVKSFPENLFAPPDPVLYTITEITE